MRSSTATVTGPTPPGTGLSQPATALTSSKATSPTVRWAPVVSSRTLLTPTSTTTAPGLTISARISPGTPAAETSTSASRVRLARSGVCLLQETTVASSRMSNTAMGLPTRFEAPTTTQRLPRSATPVDWIIVSVARAVQGTSEERP